MKDKYGTQYVRGWLWLDLEHPDKTKAQIQEAWNQEADPDAIVLSTEEVADLFATTK